MPKAVSLMCSLLIKEGKNERQLVNNERGRLKVIEDQLIEDKYLLVSSNKRDSTVLMFTV